MGFFNLFKKKTKDQDTELGRPPIAAANLNGAPPAVRMAEAMRYYEMYMESVDLISKTVYCKTFFYRYGFALENAQKIHRLSKGLDNEAAAKDMYDVLVREKTNIVNDFLFRCYDAGKIQYVKKDIVPYMSDVPKKSKELLQMMLEYESLENIAVQRNASAGLFALLLGAQMLSESGSGHKDSRYCNGDCANCPPTTDTDMVAGIMVTAIKAAVNAVAMAAHPVGHIGIDHDEAWY